MFKGAELTSYGGISLSVLRTTGFLKITGYYNVEGVEKLSLWWKKEKSQFIGNVLDVSNNIQPHNRPIKRGREEVDDEEEDDDEDSDDGCEDYDKDLIKGNNKSKRSKKE